MSYDEVSPETGQSSDAVSYTHLDVYKRQELVADLPQGGLIGLAGGIGDADDVEACVVGGAGGVEGILTDNAPVGVSAAQACKGLEKRCV